MAKNQIASSAGPNATQANERIPKEADKRGLILTEIRTRFAKSAESGIPKHIQLRKAIGSCINDGVLMPGDQIPPDQELMTAVGLSLGTIRRTLGHLSAAGFVRREHGRGTFIEHAHQALNDSWHFRFLAEDRRSLLPTYSHVLDRSLIKQPGPWQDALGPDPMGYALIDRSFDVNGRFLCYSSLYLGASRFGDLLNEPVELLESVNLKKVLNDRFGAPTVSVTQRTRVEQFSQEICEFLSIGQRTKGLFLEIIAYTFDQAPISYHQIFVPPTEYLLDLSVPNYLSRIPGDES